MLSACSWDLAPTQAARWAGHPCCQGRKPATESATCAPAMGPLPWESRARPSSLPAQVKPRAVYTPRLQQSGDMGSPPAMGSSPSESSAWSSSAAVRFLAAAMAALSTSGSCSSSISTLRRIGASPQGPAGLLLAPLVSAAAARRASLLQPLKCPGGRPLEPQVPADGGSAGRLAPHRIACRTHPQHRTQPQHRCS